MVAVTIYSQRGEKLGIANAKLESIGQSKRDRFQLNIRGIV